MKKVEYYINTYAPHNILYPIEKIEDEIVYFYNVNTKSWGKYDQTQSLLKQVRTQPKATRVHLIIYGIKE